MLRRLAGLVADMCWGPDHFVTAQMMRLDIGTGHLQWANAGHPAPLLIRDHQVVQALDSPGTLPVGFGMVRGLSHSLMRERGGTTTDDASLLLVEWRGGTADHLASPDLWNGVQPCAGAHLRWTSPAIFFGSGRPAQCHPFGKSPPAAL
ncbi:hypothetical protein A6A07_16030 [Streptomyces sp. CB03911]|nr:hypothetical protein A6A07_16030 [Streptomyces sp. CB03911]